MTKKLPDFPGRGISSRLDWIDGVRGMSILLVVLYHTVQWISITGVGVGFWIQTNEILATIRMPLFFTVSGLLATKWINEKSLSSLLSIKIATLLWIFMIWEAISCIIFSIVPNLSAPSLNSLDYLRMFFISIIWPSFQLWFLWALMIFFVTARLARNIPKGWVLSVAAVLSVLNTSDLLDLQNVGWNGVLGNSFYFFLGLRMANHIKSWASNSNPAGTVMMMLSWGVVASASVVFGFLHIPGVAFMVSVLGVIAGVKSARWLGKLGLIRWTGLNSLTVYLVHFMILAIFAFFVKTLWAGEKLTLFDNMAGLVPVFIWMLVIATCFCIDLFIRFIRLQPFLLMLPSFFQERIERIVDGLISRFSRSVR